MDLNVFLALCATLATHPFFELACCCGAGRLFLLFIAGGPVVAQGWLEVSHGIGVR